MRPHTQIIREIPIKLEPAQVWAQLADFGNICHGHPAVKKSFITSAQKTGVGATRHCDLTMMGATAEERVADPQLPRRPRRDARRRQGSGPALAR